MAQRNRTLQRAVAKKVSGPTVGRAAAQRVMVTSVREKIQNKKLNEARLKEQARVQRLKAKAKADAAEAAEKKRFLMKHDKGLYQSIVKAKKAQGKANAEVQKRKALVQALEAEMASKRA